jgi:putative restriction endonuclease
MKAFVGITDFDWFTFLSSLPEIDEINFWQPSGHQLFQTLEPGEPFLFKLHSPHNFIVGGGFFAHSSLLPASLAWDAFGIKNGANSLAEVRRRIEKYRRMVHATTEDYQIGCILLEQPFFFPNEKWIPVPANWSPSIQRGKSYDITNGLGKQLWDDVRIRLQANESIKAAEESARYGAPVLVKPRLGQGSFRIIVTDVYNRRCAVTQERTLPALEAAHIKPFSNSGPHNINNGILFRSDIHKLFDTGYVTVTPDYRFEVSRRIKEEFENGKDYYALDGRSLNIPQSGELKPAHEFIVWHNEKVFKG